MLGLGNIERGWKIVFGKVGFYNIFTRQKIVKIIKLFTLFSPGGISGALIECHAVTLTEI